VRRLCALAAILAAAGALGGCGGGEPAAGADQLVLFSPHADEIREEFGWAFQAWYKAETGRDVDVKWPDAGGTTQVLKRLQDKFRAGRYDVDVAFGGGAIFDQMRQLGMLEQYRLPEAVLAAVPKTVAGLPLYDPEFHWYGAAVSTFGLIYNKQIIADRGLPPVKDWEVLGDPKYFGLVGAVDPSKSGTMRKSCDTILQAYGYERGMAVLVRMGANAREFYPTASEVPRNCAAGFIAVGPCIDFYAERQKEGEGGRNLGFLAPPGLTVLNCDPVGIFKNAPHRAVAERFVEFVMRPEGQRLWMLPAGAPGGPRKFALQRMAVLPSVYDLPAVKAAGRTNPFEFPPATFYDAAAENDRLAILPDYLRVALIENLGPLRKAWQAIIDAGMPEDLVAELVRPEVSADEMRSLGREVWTPVVVPDGASEDEAARLRRDEESRLRRKSDLQTQWSKALRARYEDLATRAAKTP